LRLYAVADLKHKTLNIKRMMIVEQMLNNAPKPLLHIADVSGSALFNADCMDILPLIPDKSVQLILADLPYGTTANKWDSVLDLNKLWIEYERILTPKGNIVLFGAGLFAFKLALSNEKLFRYDMVWKKSKCGSPLTAKYMPLKKHEMIMVFGKSASYYYPQLTEGTPYKRKWTPNKVNNMEYGIAGVQTDNKGTRHPITVLDFPQQWRRQDQMHPTQKPLELIKWLISAYSEEGKYVLDNTMGVGTTCLGAKELNRKFIGIEKEVKYYDLAVARVFG
jgi:site-specific DNA-methyltransferase (adenine-specific)